MMNMVITHNTPITISVTSMIVSTPKSPTTRTAKRLPDPTLSSRAFAIFFIVTILIALALLVVPKADANNRNWRNKRTQSVAEPAI
jgi:lipopolysaccharide/colanic/teichoic acid biosynthesis glycosyltransferase